MWTIKMLEVRFEKKGGGKINKEFVFFPESDGENERFLSKEMTKLDTS